MNGESLNIEQDNLAKLKEQFPNLFTEGKMDWEKLKATFSDDINFANERYVLNWAGKSDAFKILQIPTTATLKPVPDESINFETTGNIFIEGENLEVLKILQKSYYNKIKFIEIDPPYNTGGDSFIYPDKFKENKAEYEKRIGEKDEEGYLMKEGMFRKNSKDSGHYHSNWLSMMYPRLFLAKNLLKDDGVIFVHIDDNEVHNLRLIMNEIFGEENFVEQIIWKNKYNAGALTNGFSNIHEYILCYSKSPIVNIEAPLTEEDIKKYNKIDEKSSQRGGFVTQPLATGSKDERLNLRYPIHYNGVEIWPEKQWIWSKERVEKAIKNNEIVFNESNGTYSPRVKQYLKDENGELRKSKPVSILIGPYNQEGSKEIKELFDANVFGFPKPSGLIRYLLSLTFNDDPSSEGLYLDFFSGSASFAHAVLEKNTEDGGNRKFICVQLPEQCDEKSEAYKAGYKTIADISKERIRRVIKKIEKSKAEKPDMFDNGKQDLGFKVFKLSASNFKIWRSNEITEENLVQQLEAFTNPVHANSPEKNMLYELMLKAGYQLTDEVEDKGNFYSIANGQLIIALKKLDEKIIAAVIAAKPKKVITLDNSYAGNDQLKTNTVLQMKDAGIDFKTI